jgi:hypothetical protein
VIKWHIAWAMAKRIQSFNDSGRLKTSVKMFNTIALSGNEYLDTSM